MTIERAEEFQMRIAKEALALMAIYGESASVARCEEAVTLIGKAWDLSAEVTAENLSQIGRASCRERV